MSPTKSYLHSGSQRLWQNFSKSSTCNFLAWTESDRLNAAQIPGSDKQLSSDARVRLLANNKGFATYGPSAYTLGQLASFAG